MPVEDSVRKVEEVQEVKEVQGTRDALEAERLRIQGEINAYPAPIPACDVYFNDLLERRSRICEQLDALKAVRDSTGSDSSC